MGKHGKKQKNPSRSSRRFPRSIVDDDSLPSSAYNLPSQVEEVEEEEETDEEEQEEEEVEVNGSALSKFDLYQKSVQVQFDLNIITKVHNFVFLQK